MCLSTLTRQGETLRNWNSLAPPSPCPTGQAGVCVCHNAWVYSPFEAGAVGCQTTVAVSTDKRSWSPLVWLRYNSVFLSVHSPKNKRRGGGGMKGCYCKQREQGKCIDILNEHWLERNGPNKNKKVRFKNTCLLLSFHTPSFLIVLCSVAQRKLHIGQPHTASCLMRAKCWVNTGCVWRLELLCAPPLYSAHRENTSAWTCLHSILTLLLFCQQTCLLPLLKLFFPVSLSFFFVTFSASLQSVPLFLGLVVRWPSTHEQLDLWPWCDLSPLLPNHAHRWEEWCLCILLFLLLERFHIIPIFRS